jgi:hypothetical protein
MSDSEDNSVTHAQEVQALIDELTGTDLLYSEEDPSNFFFNKKKAMNSLCNYRTSDHDLDHDGRH